MAELRRLVETRDDALLLFRLAWAEYWDTAANGDDVILALEVLVARAIDVGSPTMLALARLFRFLNGAGPQTESEILKIRSVFVEMRFRFFVSFCDRATAKLRSDVDRIRDAITVMTLGDEVAGSALWVRYFGEERAELLARHGRNVVAATLLGAVEATGSSRRHRTSTFTDGQAFTADRARLQFPIEFAQGTTMRLDELSVLVRSELESILAATEASREVSAL